MNSMSVFDSEGNQYDLNEDVIAWMIDLLKIIRENATEVSDFEINSNLLNDVYELLDEIETNLIKE